MKKNVLYNNNLRIQIAKFGGTSVENFLSMEQSANIILNNKNNKIIILSASAGVTNLLIELSKGNKNSTEIKHLINQICNIQYKIIDFLKKKQKIEKKINYLINNILSLTKIAKLHTSTKLTDEIISHGEMMSTLLFVEILKNKGITAKWFDIRKIMYTNNQFGNAKPDTKILQKKANEILKPKLKNYTIVTQGFIGKEPDGYTTTLGRGGSDYTASLLGEALKAKKIEIWTDVKGIYDIDPKLTPNAKIIKEMNFQEAENIANCGAKILHKYTILPALKNKIPIFVGSSKNPNLGGTLIHERTNNTKTFLALTLYKKITLLKLKNLDALYADKFLYKILNNIEKYSIKIFCITTINNYISIILTNNIENNLDEKNIHKRILKNIFYKHELKIKHNLSIITLIGNNFKKKKNKQKIFQTLYSLNINLIYYEINNHNIYLIVNKNKVENIIKKLHYNFFK